MEWIFIFSIPLIVVVGVIVRLARSRSNGLRGRQLFISVLKPVSIAMQGTSVEHGLKVESLEPTASDTNRH